MEELQEVQVEDSLPAVLEEGEEGAVVAEGDGGDAGGVGEGDGCLAVDDEAEGTFGGRVGEGVAVVGEGGLDGGSDVVVEGGTGEMKREEKEKETVGK